MEGRLESRRLIRAGVILATSALWWSAPAAAQSFSPKPYGRIAFYATTSRYSVDGLAEPTVMSEFITSVTYRAPDVEEDGFDYAVDLRQAGYAAPGRSPTLSVYDGYVGARFGGGKFLARAGHMWLNDLGALGSLAGGLFEYRRPKDPAGGLRLRGGIFSGLEPKVYETGYAANVRKTGGYVALDGNGAERHVVGYVNVRDAGLTERSVLTFTNYLPIQQRVHVYQTAEYDLSPPAGLGQGGWTYFFVNGRVSPADRVELQGLYNRGRSIDTRSLIDAQINGRPIATRMLEGLLYESVSARVYVEIVKGVRVNAGYGRDRTNQDDVPTARVSLGVHVANLVGTGLDVTVSDNRMNRPTGRYDSLYCSVGRQIGRRVYLSGDYSSSLTVIHLTAQPDQIQVDLQPRLRRLSASGVITVGSATTLLVTVERTRDQTSSELRMLAGISYRLR